MNKKYHIVVLNTSDWFSPFLILFCCYFISLLYRQPFMQDLTTWTLNYITSDELLEGEKITLYETLAIIRYRICLSVIFSLNILSFSFLLNITKQTNKTIKQQLKTAKRKNKIIKKWISQFILHELKRHFFIRNTFHHTFLC